MSTGTAVNDGVELAYEVEGDGPPLLFIQGLAYDRNGFGPTPSALADEFRVVRFDNRGVGGSDEPPGPYSVPQMATDAAAVLDELGIERAHVFGVSLGGYIAQEFALEWPERVDRLVICSTSPGGPNAYPLPQPTVEAFGKFPALSREDGLRLLVENSAGERAVRELPELIDEIYAYRLEAAPPFSAWQSQAVAGATFDAYDRIAQIQAPTLVLTGGADVVVDTRNSDLLAELIPDAKLVRIPDRGHLMVWEDSEEVTRIVREFLRG